MALRAGDEVTISGDLFTARDAAHRRLVDLLEQGKPVPFGLDGAVIYYCGPTPAPPGRPIGSAGPTTSSRMDVFAPLLHAHGVRATIGKGPRSPEVRAALQEYGGVYLVTVGGAGALLAQRVIAAELVAFAELGPEAIFRLAVEEFPAVVAYDAHGHSAFAGERKLTLLRRPQMNTSEIERTLVIVKPDGVARGLVGNILARFEAAGLSIVALRAARLAEEVAREFYAEHEGKAFYDSLITYMTSGPVVLVALEGRRAIGRVRQLCGKTDPLEAIPGTIRADFGLDGQQNTVHASDSPASAQRELALLLPEAVQGKEWGE